MSAKKPPAELGKKINDFYLVNAQRKELEKRETELKAWFKDLADGEDVNFADPESGITVSLTAKDRTGLDKDKVLAFVGEKKYPSCLTTSSYVEVSVRKAGITE